MKRNLTIGVLTLTSILSITYALYQKNRADESQAKAIKFEELASQMKKYAEEQKIIAEYQKKIAERHKVLIEMRVKEAMEKAQKKKN